jgi:hypothetical protein
MLGGFVLPAAACLGSNPKSIIDQTLLNKPASPYLMRTRAAGAKQCLPLELRLQTACVTQPRACRCTSGCQAGYRLVHLAAALPGPLALCARPPYCGALPRVILSAQLRQSTR